jgi:polysaccharide biosynthesis/export protein
MHMKHTATATAFLALVTCATAPAFAQIPTRSVAGPTPAPVPAPQPAPAPAGPAATGVPEGIGTSLPEGYVVHANDVIEVDVLGQSDFKTRARVRADGTITLPYLGIVPVADKDPVKLADELGKQLTAGGYYAKPIVSVEVISFVSNYVVVLGEVGAAGLQPIDRDYHVSEIIARAGGIKPSAGEYVLLTHPDGTTSKLDYDKLAQGGPADDPLVKAGDKVFVPQVEKFYMYGQINAPGEYAFRSDLTLQRALARGGGLTPSGSAKRVKVTRNGEEIKLKMDQPILPGDVIVIGERIF